MVTIQYDMITTGGKICQAPMPVVIEDRSPHLQWCTGPDPQRERLEQYIAGIFQAAWDARVLEFLPLLCSLQQPGRYTAALGLRSAARGPLFCEQYLEGSATSQVEAIHGQACAPRQVMELGNLVASTAGEGSKLYLLVTAAIHDAGVPHLVFAANRAVRLSICRSGFTPVVIGPARAECLGGASAQWGRYYEGDPMVMLGDMALTRQQVLARPAMAATVHRYRAPISALAAVIRQHCA